MTRYEMVKKLMKANKFDLAELCATMIDLLDTKFENEEETSYNRGWNDSRNSIINIVKEQIAELTNIKI